MLKFKATFINKDGVKMGQNYEINDEAMLGGFLHGFYACQKLIEENIVDLRSSKLNLTMIEAELKKLNVIKES